jgi:hypothetical protein
VTLQIKIGRKKVKTYWFGSAKWWHNIFAKFAKGGGRVPASLHDDAEHDGHPFSSISMTRNSHFILDALIVLRF